MTVFAATCVVLLTAMFGWGAVRVDRHQNAKVMMAAIRHDSSGEPQMAAYHFLRESTVYYANRVVTHCRNLEQLRRFLDDSPQGYVITHSSYEKELQEQFPDGFRVLLRRRRFLGPGEVLVLAPAADRPRFRSATRTPAADGPGSRR